MASDPILANQLKSSDGRFQSSTIGYWFMYSLPPYYTDGINWPIDEWRIPGTQYLIDGCGAGS
jgi:hypothetical protein